MLTKTFLKRMTHAHSWLGLIISGLLFVVFFCGSIAIYRDEISQWAVQPHYTFAEGEHKPLSDIMAKAIEDENFDAKEHLTLVLPSAQKPYYSAYVDVVHQPGEHDAISYIIDPVSGEKLNHVSQFFLADFIYKLHYDLNFEAGTYIIGIVTLFFFFALMSGILIHAKKLIGNFFKYRTEQNKRSKLLDMHNVIGVMTLPFTLMYAISGLIFNLVIIYQIAFALVLYKGDQQALLDDAGYIAIKPVWQDKPWQSPPIDKVFNDIASREHYQASYVRMYNYGDDSAVLHVGGTMAEQLGGQFEVTTELSTLKETMVNDPIDSNMVRKGLQVVANLHFGNYADYDLRLLYFIMGISVCVLIVAGNLLWIDKTFRQRTGSPREIKIASSYTLVSTAGIIFAVMVSFLLERTLAIDINDRYLLLIYSFIAALASVAVYTIISKNIRFCLANILKASGLIGLVLVSYDVLFYFNKMIALASKGLTTTAWTNASLLVLSLLAIYIGLRLQNKEKAKLVTAELATT